MVRKPISALRTAFGAVTTDGVGLSTTAHISAACRAREDYTQGTIRQGLYAEKGLYLGAAMRESTEARVLVKFFAGIFSVSKFCFVFDFVTNHIDLEGSSEWAGGMPRVSYCISSLLILCRDEIAA